MVVLAIVVAACLSYVVWYVWDLSDFAGGVGFDIGEEGGPGGLPPEDQAPPDGPGNLEAELDRILENLGGARIEKERVLLRS